MSQDRRLEGDIRMGPCVGVNVDGWAWGGGLVCMQQVRFS